MNDIYTTNDFTLHTQEIFSDSDNKDDLNILHDLVKELWRLDNNLGTSKDIELSQEDLRSMDIINKTLRRIDYNKFECGLLWKSDNIQLPESDNNALARLYYLESKMDKDLQYGKKYCEKFNEYIQKGHLKKLSPDEIDVQTNLTFY